MSESFDYVIVGSGGGSMCAALVMRAAGKSVVILEKSDLVGGTTAISGGVMWIPNNRFMAQENISDSREDAIAYLDATVGDNPEYKGATRERRIAYVDESPKMIDFLVEQGIKLRRIPSWPDYYQVPGESVPGRTVVSELFDIKQLGEWKEKLRPGFLPLPANLDEAMQMALMKRSGTAKKTLAKIIGRVIKDIFTGKKRTTAGQALQGQMLNAALKAGVDIRLETPVKDFVIQNGRVVGVVASNNGADKNGEDISFEGKLGVLINAGGFARNQTMLDQYIPGAQAQWSNVIPEDMGDLIQTGQKHGAAIAQMKERIGMQVAMVPDKKGGLKTTPIQNDLSKPYSIVVDQMGKRYANESGSSVEFTRHMLEHADQNQSIPSWLICDSRYLQTFMLAGSMPGDKKPQPWTDEGFLKQADSIKSLAALCEIDADSLVQTVDQYNAQISKGKDDDFQRGETAYEQWLGDPLKEGDKSLGTIEEGPFYALQIFPGDVSTFGGLVTDVHGRVLREDNTVIEGLYATGTSTASVMGGVEPGAGGSIGPSFTWGYISAKHALGG